MSKIISIFLVAILVVQSGCFYKRYFRNEDWVYFEDWDRDQNKAIDSLEFSGGYLEEEFFKKWSARENDITYHEFYKQLFESLDIDDSSRMEGSEVTSARAQFFFKAPPESRSMTEEEFTTYLSKNNIAQRYDINKDNKISDFEMAGMMFANSDEDHNHSLGSLEFYDWEIYR